MSKDISPGIAPSDPQFADIVLKSFRKVVDLSINSAVVPDTYPCPDPFECASDVSQFGDVFWCADLSEGYHQIILSPESRHLTEHQSVLGNVSYARLPQGLVGASQRMQRCNDALFGRLSKTKGFYDNLAGGEFSFADLLKNLIAFLEVCKNTMFV